jgi:hypothetical protein
VTKKTLGFILGQHDEYKRKEQAIYYLYLIVTETTLGCILGQHDELGRKEQAIYYLYLIVTETTLGCILGQHDELGRKEQVIYYLSKKFNDCESRYTTIERLCYALVQSTKRLRQYMLYYTTWLISKLGSFKYIYENPYQSSRIAWWQVLLMEYNVVYMTRKVVKESVVVDHLADHALEDYEVLNFSLPGEEVLIAMDNGKMNDW